MEKINIEKCYIITDCCLGLFWDGNFYSNPEKVKIFRTPEEAKEEIRNKIIPTFRCIAEIKEVYINLGGIKPPPKGYTYLP